MLGKKKIIAIILGGCILTGSMVIMAKPKPEQPVVKEIEHTVVRDDITVGTDGGGVIKLDEANQKFKINGVIEEIYVKKGQKIKKGDKIAKISEKGINEQIDELKLEKADKEKIINSQKSEEVLDSVTEMKKELENIDKKIKKLKSDLNNVYVYASSEGVIINLGAEIGEDVTASKVVAVIGTYENVYLDVLLSQTDIIDVKEEQKIKATLETYPDIEIEGVVKEKSYVSSEQGEDVDYKVRITLSPNDLEIYPGMTAEVKFITKNKENVLQIPNKAIKRVDNKQVVRIKDNEGIKEIEVKTGFSDGNVTEIVEGLQDGQIIIEER